MFTFSFRFTRLTLKADRGTTTPLSGIWIFRIVCKMLILRYRKVQHLDDFTCCNEISNSDPTTKRKFSSVEITTVKRGYLQIARRIACSPFPKNVQVSTLISFGCYCLITFPLWPDLIAASRCWASTSVLVTAWNRQFHHSQDYPTTRGMTKARQNNAEYVLTVYLDHSEGEREGIAI